MKVSVVVPIYKVERFVERCLRSLMEQTLQDVEFILVDDASPDRSMAVVERVLKGYPDRSGQVKVLRHEVNRGVSFARRTGLLQAEGDFIYHCDSDDFLELDALEKMFNAALIHRADIVYTDWYLTFRKKERLMKQPACDSPEQALKCLLHGSMKYNVWNKLVKKSLYSDYKISFPEGHSVGEDMTMIRLFLFAKSVIYLPVATYHYNQQNVNAYSVQKPSERVYSDIYYNALLVIGSLNQIVSEYDINCFKLNVKFPFLISPDIDSYEKWQQWFPEANAAISTHDVSWRMRMLERFAARRWYFLLKCYYYYVHRVMYGLIYS